MVRFLTWNIDICWHYADVGHLLVSLSQSIERRIVKFSQNERLWSLDPCSVVTGRGSVSSCAALGEMTLFPSISHL